MRFIIRENGEFKIVIADEAPEGALCQTPGEVSDISILDIVEIGPGEWACSVNRARLDAKVEAERAAMQALVEANRAAEEAANRGDA